MEWYSPFAFIVYHLWPWLAFCVVWHFLFVKAGAAKWAEKIGRK